MICPRKTRKDAKKGRTFGGSGCGARAVGDRAAGIKSKSKIKKKTAWAVEGLIRRREIGGKVVVVGEGVARVGGDG